MLASMQEKMDTYNTDFWRTLDELVRQSEIVIDRPKGTAHPKFPDFIYKVDYGYIENTSSMMEQVLMFGLVQGKIKVLMP